MKHRTRRPAGTRAAQIDLIGFDHQAIAPPKCGERKAFYSAVVFLRKDGLRVTRRGNRHAHIKGPWVDKVLETRAVIEYAERLGWKR